MKLISKIIKFFGFKPKLKVFIYGYLRSPFDSEQKFYLEAIDEKEALFLSCKASRWALLPRLPRIDVRMRLLSSTIGKLADIEYNRTLTTDIFLSTGRCDRAGNKQLTGTLQQEYSHS